MHSHHRRHGGLSRWLATGAAVFAVAIPAAATASASAPPTEPSGSSEPAAGDTATGDSTAAGAACANVFPLDAAPTSDVGASAAPADDSAAPADDSAADVTMAAPDTAADVAAAPDTAAATGDTATDASTGASTDSSATGGAVVAGPIQTAETALGTILVDGDCRALYAFTADVDGESTCVDGCAAAWPPLLVEGDAVPELAADLDPALFSVVEHPLGPMLKVGDFPLYYFASDVAPGDLNGQAVNDVWWVVAPDGTLIGADGGASSAPAGSAVPADSAVTATAEATAGSDAATAGSETKATDTGY